MTSVVLVEIPASASLSQIYGMPVVTTLPEVDVPLLCPAVVVVAAEKLG